ncbi:iron uptake transporter permease EfeU [Arachnia propionica]|uniref:High-affinity Fe2+/Pb2+ permease n=1 Tax=Arachnia propionica TaxID=1750 RepID=A0A3P1X379_9ACTN|nr:iron uptake transporter permease EfeU [Arachnia propionica]RRD51223.1 high-affinity Fe2+/Pb2+ permease [Arachnia propionica]
MFLGAFLIGLREGLEASLIIGILIAYVLKQQRRDVVPRIWLGVGIAITASLLLGAAFTFGRYGLSFEGQELLGGGMSLLAVVMVTWMVFWMLRAGRTMKAELESSAATAIGTGWGMFGLAFISVGREGIETTLMLWAWLTEPVALAGALIGLVTAAIMGWFVYKGMLRIRFSTFFAWTGTLLIIMTAGILAYGIHDLQEARFLPGPFSGAPITPVNFRTGEVLVGFFTEIPYWGAPFPFGWAFDLQDVIAPDSWLAALLKGTVGFTPLMSWLEITAWAIYLAIVLPMFIRRVRHATPRKESHEVPQSA